MVGNGDNKANIRSGYKKDRSIQKEYIPDSAAKCSKHYIEALNVGCLISFKNHPFKRYEENCLNDLVESIIESGIISPIIVRPMSDGKYEILSGHNRVDAAKKAGLQSVPAIVFDGLTDDEAKLIVTETNLIQRSFSDMLHSERAIAISMHYEAIKKKSGYRSDLLDEINEMTCSPVASRLRTMNKLGEQLELSKDTIARYLRINKLTKTLQERLDKNEIAMRTAVLLSYLHMDEQEEVNQFLQTNRKINMRQAEMLREESAKGHLSREIIEQILTRPPMKAQPIKLSRKLFSQYFIEDQTVAEIEHIITEALKQYFQNK